TTTIFVAYAEYDPVLDAAVIREVIAVESVSAGSAASGKFIAGDKPVSVRLNGGEEFMLTRNFHLSDFLYKVRAGGTLVFKVLRGASTVDITVAAKASDMNPV
ncbi:MAG: hypothetical protein LBS99_02200, partial [Clostridiales bacterium]|nr:hypothetical protein [Clostridiales bacterium]